MSRYIDCTMPFYDFMPVGNVWAWDVPFQTRPITTHAQNSYELWMITMHSETGTRLMIKAMQDPNAPTVDRLPLEQFLNRDAVVLDTPCGRDGFVTAEQVEEAVKNAEIHKGDVFILRTGWGDDERYLEIGDDYARHGPAVSKAGAETLCRIMHEYESNLAASDVAYWGRGEKYQGPLWADRPAYARNPFPSVEARRFLAQYTPEKAIEDWESPNVMTTNGINFIGAMVNLNKITKQRIKLSVIPMKLKGARGAPCSVIAEEI